WWDARRSRASPSVAGRPLFPVRGEERFADAGLDRRLLRREAARQDAGLAKSPFPPYCAAAGREHRPRSGFPRKDPFVGLASLCSTNPMSGVRTSVLVAMKAVRTADGIGAAPPLAPRPVRGKPRPAVAVTMR